MSRLLQTIFLDKTCSVIDKSDQKRLRFCPRKSFRIGKDIGVLWTELIRMFGSDPTTGGGWHGLLVNESTKMLT